MEGRWIEKIKKGLRIPWFSIIIYRIFHPL